MNVEEAEPGRGEHGIGEDFPVRRDDSQIGAQCGERSQEPGIRQPIGLKKRQPCRGGADLDGRGGRLLTTAARAIGSRHDADDVMVRPQQRVERRHGEVRRAEEHEPQPVNRHHLPARVSFLILLTIRSRLMPRSRSTNSVPSR